MELAYKLSSVFDVYSFHINCRDHKIPTNVKNALIILNQVTLGVMRAMAKNYYILPRGAMQFGTQLLTYEEDVTSILFDPRMDVEVPPETSVLINEITEHDSAKTVKLIEQKPV